jgi:hypothetical protein
MIKIISAAYHMNIGDSRSARLLKGYIDTINNHESVLYGYEGTCLSSQEEVERFCSDSDAIIIGTGGIFHDADYNQVFHFTDPELYKYISCPLMVMATGFNHDYCDGDGIHIDILSSLFQRADLIGMRTEEDKYLAISLGADANKTFVCPDPLLFIGYNSDVIDQNVAVSLWDDGWRYIVEEELLKRDCIPVNINHEDTSFRFVDYANCDFTISNRFHGQLLSFAYNKPCFSIESNVKHQFARQLLYPKDLYYYAEDETTFIEKLDEFIDNKEKMREYIPNRLSGLKNMFGDFLLKVEKIIND